MGRLRNVKILNIPVFLVRVSFVHSIFVSMIKNNENQKLTSISIFDFKRKLNERMTHGPFLQWSIEDLPSRPLKHQETTCVTADHKRPNNFPISRAIIYHFSWDNFHLLQDNFPFIARYFDFIVRCMRFIARFQKKERKIACPLWATVCFGIVLLIFVT